MEIIKKIDLGEYFVVIKYEENTGFLKISVLDELKEVIESIEITNNEYEDIDDLFGGLLN